jgi:hypothetical protein
MKEKLEGWGYEEIHWDWDDKLQVFVGRETGEHRSRDEMENHQEKYKGTFSKIERNP